MKQEIKVEKEKMISTAFILMYPALILATMAVYYAHSIFISILAIALAVYQFLMMKKFIDDYYRNR